MQHTTDVSIEVMDETVHVEEVCVCVLPLKVPLIHTSSAFNMTYTRVWDKPPQLTIMLFCKYQMNVTAVMRFDSLTNRTVAAKPSASTINSSMRL